MGLKKDGKRLVKVGRKAARDLGKGGKAWVGNVFRVALGVIEDEVKRSGKGAARTPAKRTATVSTKVAMKKPAVVAAKRPATASTRVATKKPATGATKRPPKRRSQARTRPAPASRARPAADAPAELPADGAMPASDVPGNAAEIPDTDETP